MALITSGWGIMRSRASNGPDHLGLCALQVAATGSFSLGAVLAALVNPDLQRSLAGVWRLAKKTENDHYDRMLQGELPQSVAAVRELGH